MDWWVGWVLLKQNWITTNIGGIVIQELSRSLGTDIEVVLGLDWWDLAFSAAHFGPEVHSGCVEWSYITKKTRFNPGLDHKLNPAQVLWSHWLEGQLLLTYSVKQDDLLARWNHRVLHSREKRKREKTYLNALEFLQDLQRAPSIWIRLNLA